MPPDLQASLSANLLRRHHEARTIELQEHADIGLLVSTPDGGAHEGDASVHFYSAVLQLRRSGRSHVWYLGLVAHRDLDLLGIGSLGEVLEIEQKLFNV